MLEINNIWRHCINFISTPRRISLALGVSRFLKMFFGIVVLYLSVKYFGTTFQRDSWVLSIAFWGIVICLLYSPINEIFRTKFIYIKEQEGEEAAIKSVNSLMNLFNLSYLVIAVIVFFCISPLTALFAPGFDDEMRRYLSLMIFSLIPFFVLQQHITILIGILNTYESYFYPEIVFLLSSIINIISIIFLSKLIGIYSLVVSTTFNNVMMVAILTHMIKKKVASFRLISREHIKWASPFVKLSLPMYLSAICSQLYLFVEKSLCTHFGEGMVSVFDYARQIATMPYVVFSTIVPIVMTPILSLAFINGDEDKFSDEMRRLFHLFLYLTCFFVIMMIINGEQISFLLFTSKNVVFMDVLAYLSLGILFMTITLMLGQALIARDRVVDYVLSVISGNIVSIFLCFIFVYVPPFIENNFRISSHIENMAISFFIGQLLSFLIAFYKIRIKRKNLFFKSLVILLLACVASFGLTSLFQNLMSGTILMSVDMFYLMLDISICAVIILGVLLCVLMIFDVDERKTIYGLCASFSNKCFKRK